MDVRIMEDGDVDAICVSRSCVILPVWFFTTFLISTSATQNVSPASSTAASNFKTTTSGKQQVIGQPSGLAGVINITSLTWQFSDESPYVLIRLSLRSLRYNSWPYSDDIIFLDFIAFVAYALIERGMKYLDAALSRFRDYSIPSGRLAAPNILLLHYPPDTDPQREKYHQTMERTSPCMGIQYLLQVYPEVLDPTMFLVLDLYRRLFNIREGPGKR